MPQRLRPDAPAAITFDFYQTLVRPRSGKGRGELYQDFLRCHGLTSLPWEHQVLYDVFEFYAESYHPGSSPEEKDAFWTLFSSRLFERTGVSVDKDRLSGLSKDIQGIMGPPQFELFPEVQQTLEALRTRKVPIAILSNWQKGLPFFAAELGLSKYFDEVIASAEVGCEKPDPRIFQIVCQRLGISPEQLLHVGDSFEDDVEGALAAGASPLWLVRDGATSKHRVPRIESLDEVLDFSGW